MTQTPKKCDAKRLQILYGIQAIRKPEVVQLCERQMRTKMMNCYGDSDYADDAFLDEKALMS